MYRIWRRGSPLLLTLLLAVISLHPFFSGSGFGKTGSELWKMLRPLDKVISFMNTGAHPDDEFSASLAWLSLGQGVRTSSLLANRGEGEQTRSGMNWATGWASSAPGNCRKRPVCWARICFCSVNRRMIPSMISVFPNLRWRLWTNGEKRWSTSG